MNRYLEFGNLNSFLSTHRKPRESVVLRPGLVPVNVRPQNVTNIHKPIQNFQNIDFNRNGTGYISKDVYAPAFVDIRPALQVTGMTQYSKAIVQTRDRII